MRIGGRVQAAAEVLADIDARRRPASEALKDWGLSHRFAGSGDRAAIGNLVYDALRHRRSLGWLADSEAPRDILFALLVRVWSFDRDELLAVMADDRHAPELPAPETLTAIADRDISDAPEEVQADLPDWLVDAWKTAFGEAWLEEARAATARPPLDIRVNTLKATPEKVAKALHRFGATATPHAAAGLRIPPTEGFGRHPNVTTEPAYQKGWFEIQDEGSQLAASLTGAASGQKVLDLCAGGGGKSLALSMAMGNTGQVFATDADRSRLAPIFERLKRAGTRNVQVRGAGEAVDDLAEKLDLVVIDAPCSGTGTWRRRPDTKWRLRPEALEARVAEQAAILDAAAPLPRNGGRIAYITCSCLPQENDEQVRAFASRHPDYRMVPMQETAAAIGLDDASARFGEGVLLSPGQTGTDAFFVALLERGV